MPGGDEKRAFAPRLRARSRVGPVARRGLDDGHRDTPPQPALLKGGRARNECGGKPALVTMTVFIRPPQTSPTMRESFLGLRHLGACRPPSKQKHFSPPPRFAWSTPTFHQPGLTLPESRKAVWRAVAAFKSDGSGDLAVISSASNGAIERRLSRNRENGSFPGSLFPLGQVR
jgi:hypothetical protein